MQLKKLHELEQEGWDMSLIAKTQPQGNVKFRSNYMQMGDGYVACLRVYRYPSHGLPMFWGFSLVNNSSTMTFLDVGTEDRGEIIAALSRSAREMRTQVSSSAKELDSLSAGSAYHDQLALMQQILGENEVMKRFYFRIFVYDKTLDGLEKKCQAIINDNSQFGMVRFSEEQYYDYKSIFMPTMKEQGLPNKPVGTPISAYSLGGAYPFNHVKLEDPHGFYYGYTRTSGEVEFDPFQRDHRRTRSFFFVTGNAGMGKSTLLKKMCDDVFARGAYIRNFDVSSEYTDQTRDQGGVIIRLDSPENLINPFEVFPTVINADGSVDDPNSFAQHRSKLQNFFSFLQPDATNDDRELLGQWIQEFYIEQNLWVKNPQLQAVPPKITGLAHDMYPTLEDFVVFIKAKKRSLERDTRFKLTDSIATSMNRIVATFETALTSYSEMFNGITRFPDLSKEQVVTFNIQGLVSQGNKGLFNAQMYSILSLLSADIIKNGQEQRKLLKEGRLDPNFIRWYYLNIDEVENIINPDFVFGVQFLASMMEQMRKNMCAITMAAPTIKDLIMNGSSQDPYILAVQKIFSLFQIRFFFQISDDDVPRLEIALGGSTTKDELQNLTKLEKTECLMNINGDRNVQFKVQITPEEERRYGGGI